MTGRLRCVVPGCRRTAPGEDVEDDACLCSKHWRAVPLEWRCIYRRRRAAMFAQREANNASARANGGVRIEDVDAEIILRHVVSRLWRCMAREAIEKAVGLA